MVGMFNLGKKWLVQKGSNPYKMYHTQKQTTIVH